MRRSDDEGDILAQFVAKTWPQQTKTWRWLEYWDDDGDQLNFVNVEARMNRDRRLMNKLEVAEEVSRFAVPSESRICTGGRSQKGGGVRNRYVIRQRAKEARNEDALSGSPS